MEGVSRLNQENSIEKAKLKASKINNLELQSSSGEYVELTEMKDDHDLHELYDLINQDSEFRDFISKKFKESENFETFKEQIKKWFDTDTNFVFLAKDKSFNTFGVAILYGLNTLRNEVKISIFINKEKRNSRSLLEVFLLSLSFVINKLDTENIKFNVYKDNTYMMNIIKNRKEFGIIKISDNSETETFLLPRESAINLINRFKEIY